MQNINLWLGGDRKKPQRSETQGEVGERGRGGRGAWRWWKEVEEGECRMGENFSNVVITPEDLPWASALRGRF